MSSLPEPRSDHAQVAVGSTLYVLGGFVRVEPAQYISASVLKLDTLQGIWNAVAPMPAPRYDFAACVVGSDIYVFGGISYDFRDQESVYKYDTRTDTWSTLAPVPSVASGHTAIELGGLIYLVGTGDFNCGLMCYDPASGVWKSMAPMRHSCRSGTSFVLGGCLYAAGGETTESNVNRYDVATNTWTEVAGMLEGRAHFGAVTIGYIITTFILTPSCYSDAV
jgi:kelch-like protein 20/kelch-like protein 24/35